MTMAMTATRMKAIRGWAERRSPRTKALLAAVAALLIAVVFTLVVRDMEHFFVASDAVHAAGILLLVLKLTRKRSCAGVSLKTQELTAVLLGARIYSSFTLDRKRHAFLDCATLLPTLWVVYMIRFRHKSTYSSNLDKMPRFYLVVPSLVLAFFLHPFPREYKYQGIVWAFSVFLESVSVLPQLRLMQNTRTVEPFTSTYVFALGVSRFLGLANYLYLSIMLGPSFLTFHLESGYWWPIIVFACDLVQSFILADFCYYYVKSCMFHQLSLSIRLPAAKSSKASV